MSLSLRVAVIADLDRIYSFESSRLQDQMGDEMERSIFSWNARWRKESLEHYLPMGWSFIADDEQENLAGYFIAQPLLFFDGNTQSLWLEHISASSPAAMEQLCEVAYKIGREKHLQKVFFPNHEMVANIVKNWQGVSWNPETIQVKTTK
jgi:hypothetical protein